MKFEIQPYIAYSRTVGNIGLHKVHNTLCDIFPGSKNLLNYLEERTFTNIVSLIVRLVKKDCGPH